MIVIPDSEVRLLSNVPLNNSYEHQMTFGSQGEQADWFMTKTSAHFTEFTYVREDSTLRVPRGRNGLYAANYLMFRNTEFHDKWFYAFITKVEYVNPNMSKIHFEIDPYQTWQFNFFFKPSFIEREHQDRWLLSDGSPVVNTIDEGLNYGTDYDTVSIEKWVPFSPVYFLVIVCKERMDNGSSEVMPSVNGAIQPLVYYVHPIKLDGSVPYVFINGISADLSSPAKVLTTLYKDSTAVNNIVSLYITEHIGKDFSYDEGQDKLTMPTNFSRQIVGEGADQINTLLCESVGIYNKSFKSFGNKYDGYHGVTESKLLMHPYTVLILDDFKGNRTEYKNEYIDSQTLAVTARGSMGTSNKVAYGIEQYNSPTLSGTDLQQLSLETALINNNPNDVPIITDLLAAYLQGNRNQIQNQTNQLMFNGVAGAVGSGVAAIGSALMRNGAGAAAGAGSLVTGAANTHFQLEGIQAKQRDIDNTPPNITKQGSNTAFDYGNGYTGVYIIKKQIKYEYRKQLGDYFKMFGYKCNEVKVPDLKSRQHWNYIKTVGAMIYGNIPADDLAVIKRMFDNGVTLWHTDDVGNYAYDNNEV